MDLCIQIWYRQRCSKEECFSLLESDIVTLLANPEQISDVFKSRIILTNYFSRSHQLEDCYGYGDIEPALFLSDGKSISFRDTLFDRVDFPQRVQLITSFDPEPKGHKHQIRYFRVLLSAYSMAHALKAISTDVNVQQVVDFLLKDEIELARGWMTAKNRANNIGLNPREFLPDESMLYSTAKVQESASLFEIYARYAQRLLGGASD